MSGPKPDITRHLAAFKLYQSGMMVEKIAEEFGISLTSTYRYLNKARLELGVAAYRDRGMSADSRRILELYEQGLTYTEVGAIVGKNKEKVRYSVRRWGTPRQRQEKEPLQQMSLDERYMGRKYEDIRLRAKGSGDVQKGMCRDSGDPIISDNAGMR